MDNYYLTEQTTSTDDFSKSFEYIITGSTITSRKKSDKFHSIGNGLLSEGFYLGHNLTTHLAYINVQNSNSCILSIPTKGEYSTRLSGKNFNTCTPETGSLFLPTDSILYTTNLEVIDDLIIIVSYEQLKPILENNYNIGRIAQEGFSIEKKSEKVQIIYNLITNKLQALKFYPHLRDSLHLKASIKEIAKLFLAELIADSLKIEFKKINSPDSGLVKKAEELMEANPEKFFSIQQIANDVLTSPRNLQLVFKKHRGYTPMQFLKERKLQRARLLLFNAEPYSSIKKVAIESGFLNMSTFSKYYQQLFGELPSETLHNAKQAYSID